MSLITDLVDKQFEIGGYKYDHKTGTTDPHWYSIFTKTQDQKKAFADWAIPYIQKKNRCGKKQAQKFLNYFEFQYGFREVG
ncbi:MAG: hypothetical protein KBA02_06580 [Paludibacteraceae bacterium]|nr:hypothetical protein [Paludibacteraceae bacterium]